MNHKIHPPFISNPLSHYQDNKLLVELLLSVLRQCATCAMTSIAATPRSDISLQVGLFPCTIPNISNCAMQSSPSIPCFLLNSVSSIVINATQWNEDTLRDVIISFTKLEQVADSMFKKIEEQVQTTSSRVHSLEDASSLVLFHT